MDCEFKDVIVLYDNYSIQGTGVFLEDSRMWQVTHPGVGVLILPMDRVIVIERFD